uniref:Very-long-chain (3R)-3-hydroxyacyl-CoA dehydratase n=1 Tax=Kryptolebias marmoratus TaxID=37003 RepID=A0A3Q3F1Q2_KRYMA
MSAAAPGTSKAAHGEAGPKKKKGPGALATAYLVIYNVVMTAGWLVIAVGLVRAYLARGSYHGLYYSIEKPLKFVLWAAENSFFPYLTVFSVLSPNSGIVPSSVVLTGFQVMSRVFLTWAVTHSVREVQSEDSVLLFVTAWTITEIIRYSFYTFSLLNHLPYLIKWARYTFFIVLYPMGVTGELLTIYAALPYVQKTGLYSVTLPNKYNFSFDYYTFLILVMVSYIPLFPQLYFHMIRQRKKVLGHTEDYSKIE